MSSPRAAAIRGILPPLLLITCLVVAGCATDDRKNGRPGNRPPQAQAFPTLTGRETFFTGRITVEVRIGALAISDRSKNGGERDPEGRPRRGPPGGGSGPGGPGGPGMHPGAGMDRPPPGAVRADARGAPPVAIHLSFTNESSTPVDLEIVDFLSPLGNFAVQPSRLRLEPGESRAVEPMGSRLTNVATSGEIALSLRLDAVKETRTVTVHAEPNDFPPVAR